MIKINLLPFRAARKKENIKRQISIYIASVLIVIAAVLIQSQNINKKLATVKEKEVAVQADLAKYQKRLAEIKQLQKKIKEISAKLVVIKGLEDGKSGPVHMLDEVSTAVPKDKLWLNSLRESKGTLTVSGTAMDNETVALFMTNLEKSKYINNVNLQSSRMKLLPQYKLRVSDFVMDAKTVAYKKPPPNEVKKSGRK